ncbi:hypothetical protein [[Mycoplasma] collis]|uniref:hypothetical protein n=1 Tax=[Mycoplasma] collis TaxID=2127 RepID=UPI00051AB925|nr:hypothetical protein [[Mycoplasma] collis]
MIKNLVSSSYEKIKYFSSANVEPIKNIVNGVNDQIKAIILVLLGLIVAGLMVACIFYLIMAVFTDRKDHYVKQLRFTAIAFLIIFTITIVIWPLVMSSIENATTIAQTG